MQDHTINQIHVQDITGTDANLQPTVTKRVTFYVGKNGPFVLTYKPSEYSADQVQRDMEKEVATLNAICAQAGTAQ